MVSLKGKVTVVTGASRGVGKGLALGLGEAGAAVYVTGRSAQEKQDVEKLGGTVFSTAEAVSALGGKGVAIQCDHRNDSQVEAAFQRIAKDLAHLKRIVELIVEGDLLQAHFDGNFIELVAVHHFGAHFGKEAFFLIRIFLKKKIGYDPTENCISEVLEPFIIFVCAIPNRPMGKGSLI